ncbi:hypothetical protein DL770_009919 [Monosporascus sp. CRB-9-2]|nr:hypothetical protein DL770_009919 [Monosporascus sp. CRB-9-2]
MEIPLQTPKPQVNILTDYISEEEMSFIVYCHDSTFKHVTAADSNGQPLFHVMGTTFGTSWSWRRKVYDSSNDQHIFDFRHHSLDIKNGWVAESPTGRKLCSLENKSQIATKHFAIDATVYAESGEDVLVLMRPTDPSALTVTISVGGTAIATIRKAEDNTTFRGKRDRSVWAVQRTNCNNPCEGVVLWPARLRTLPTFSAIKPDMADAAETSIRQLPHQDQPLMPDPDSLFDPITLSLYLLIHMTGFKMSKDKDPVSGEPRRRKADHNSAGEESDLDCYSPLSKQGSIRLLRLMPHKDKKAPMQCQLFEYPLQEQGEGTHLYEALSYEWGSKDNRQPVYIQSDDESDRYPTAEMKRGFDGRSYPPAGNNRRLFITANLDAALSHLRDRFVERIIWVDAICINQKDSNEKGQQIQFMARIFAKASRVIVWLGEVADNSDQALDVIRKAAKEQSTNAAINETNKQAILTLLKRPWFQRIWVLQEVAAARHILIKCGPTEIDGYAFCLGLSALQLSYETCPDLQGLIRPVAYLIRDAIFRPRYEKDETSRPGGFSLEIRPLSELMDMYHTRKATIIHDKVYALLGMSSDDPSTAGLSPNYESSWKEVFRKLIKFSTSDQMSVDAWDDKEVAVIMGKGCILGKVSSVERNNTRDDRQTVGITWKNTTGHFDTKGERSPEFTFPASAKPIQAGKNLRKAVEVYGTALRSVGNSHGPWGEADKGALAVMNDLLIKDKGAAIEAKYKEYGQAPLSWAAGEGHELVVRLLVEKGADIEAKDGYGRTPLSWAAGNGHEAVVRMLVEKGADIEAKDGYGQTPLSWAAGNGHEAVMGMLVEKGAAIEAKDKEHGRTPLWWAAEYGHEAVVRMLVEKGADIEAKDRKGQTPLSWAAEYGHEAVMGMLVEKGAAIEAKDKEHGRTPLSRRMRSTAGRRCRGPS